jgi:hypothetical protein
MAEGERDRETVVVTDTGDRSGGSGMIIAIVLLLAILVVGYLLYSNGVFGGSTTNIKVPDKIDVNVNPSK